MNDITIQNKRLFNLFLNLVERLSLKIQETRGEKVKLTG